VMAAAAGQLDQPTFELVHRPGLVSALSGCTASALTSFARSKVAAASGLASLAHLQAVPS